MAMTKQGQKVKKLVDTCWMQTYDLQNIVEETQRLADGIIDTQEELRARDNPDLKRDMQALQNFQNTIGEIFRPG